MAVFKCLKCGEPKDVESGFFKGPTKRGHDTACKACRRISANKRYHLLAARKREIAASKPKPDAVTLKAAGKGPGNNQGRYVPTLEQIEQEKQLIKAENLLAMRYSLPAYQDKAETGCKRIKPYRRANDHLGRNY